MVVSSFKYLRYNFLDNIEMFISENEAAYFPFHLHDYFCISLITKGTELLQTQNSVYYAIAGTISVTQANEVHKNCSLNDSGYSYQTIYINPDLLTYYNNGKKVPCLERVIQNEKLVVLFGVLFKSEQTTFKVIEQIIKELLRHQTNILNKEKLPLLNTVDGLIASTGINRLTLDMMASHFCISKYHFIRRFKETSGITPQVYVALQRLGNAKKMLLHGKEIKEAAFLNGFYDATHLNSAFKRYFGITASSIKNSNIIQSG
ncbi:MAG TPA: AraC family transcriptional regulator [Mucilaginibacter sp.]|jgi:AraC-like DNA-binding protein|nr:AraC family transcriptional regulator [Mucilaginibacter sp.]